MQVSMTMSFFKQLKDHIVRGLLNGKTVPSGLAELNHYFRIYGPINFRRETQGDGADIVISENFRYGSIITRVGRGEDADAKITDAILTAFEVPSSYAKDAAVHRVDKRQYAFA